MDRELDANETTSKILSPHIRRRAVIIRRLAQLSCLILLIYAVSTLRGYQAPSFHQVWLAFIHRAESAFQFAFPFRAGL